MTLWNKINSFSRENELFKAKDFILLAVSGGPDSVVLLDYFAKQAQSLKLRLKIAHVNHHLRGKDSDGDAKFVKALGEKYGIETFILSANVKQIAIEEKKGIESAARKARYALITQTALEQKCSLVATAHHSDDNAETILLNILRGTEPKGLLGIPLKRPLYKHGKKEILLIRPLLSATRKEIEKYIKLNSLESRKDITNDDDRYTRNWIRKKLLPMMEKKQPRLREHLQTMSQKLYNIIN